MTEIYFFSLIISGTRSGRAAAPPPLGSLLVLLPALWVVPPHTSLELSVLHQAAIVGVSKAQVSPARSGQSAQFQPDIHQKSGHLLLAVPAVPPLLPMSRCVSVRAAPSELPQLPVPAKRFLSLTLDRGLMLFQKVLPRCAFGVYYLIGSNQPPSHCRHC